MNDAFKNPNDKAKCLLDLRKCLIARISLKQSQAVLHRWEKLTSTMAKQLSRSSSWPLEKEIVLKGFFDPKLGFLR